MDEELIQEFEMFNRAADSNRTPILNELKRLLVVGDTVLEIGSGSGQHAVYFAAEMPGITWQPTDRGPYFAALDANLSRVSLSNMEQVEYLDVEDFPDYLNCDVAYCANVLHIMPERLMPALFEGVARCLVEQGNFIVYGPFRYNGAFTTPSNEKFDDWLKSQDPQQGIRDMERVQEEAARNNLRLIEDVAMPANNQFLVFRKSVRM